MVLRADPLATTPAAAKVTALADAILVIVAIIMLIFILWRWE